MKPVKIEINNLFKYGKENNIFRFGDGCLTLIVGPNGAGKSSIFEAISFALFEQTVRWGTTKKSILRRGAEKGFARLTFEHDGKVYEVTRYRERDGSGSVSFEDVETTERMGRGTKDTNARIIETIGFDFEAFRNSVLFGQHDLAKVVSLRSGDRLELLTNFLGLGILERCFEVSRSKASYVKSEMESLDAEIEIKNIIEMRRQLKIMRQIEAEHIASVKEAETKYGDLKELVNKLDRMEQAFSKSATMVENNTDEMRSLITQKKSLQKASGKTMDEKKIEQDIKKAQEAEDALEGIRIQIGELTSAEQEVNEEYIEAKADCRRIRDKIAHIRRKKHCTECDRPIDQETRDALTEKQKDRLEKAEGKRDKVKSKLDKKRGELKALKAEETQIKKQPDPDVLWDKLKEARRQGQLQDEVESIEERIAKKKVLIKRHSAILDEIKEEGYSEERLERLKEGLLKAKGNVSESETELKNTQKNIKELKRLISQVKDLEKHRDRLAEKYKLSQFVFEMFSKTGGIRQVIVENVLPVLNSKINRYLDLLSDEGISVEFTTGTRTKKGLFKNKLEILIVSPDGIADFASYSGGEKQTIILAIGLGISELAAESVGMDCEVLLMDEVFSSLDSKARKRLVNLMGSLQKKFKNVVTISHLKELKTQVPEVVVVKRTKGLSRIKQ